MSTQTPWTVEAQGVANVYRIRSADGWLAIVQMNGELWTAEQMRVLQMMAAAPDMLKALRFLDLTGALDCSVDPQAPCSDEGQLCYHCAARAAIAKATGGAA